MTEQLDFGSLETDTRFVELAGETRMLLCRWIHSIDDEPLAKINVNAYIAAERVSEGGVSVRARFSVDIFESEGWRVRDGETVPDWRIRMHQNVGDWDDEVISRCARQAHDPAFALYVNDGACRAEIAKRAPKLAAHYDRLILQRSTPDPAGLTAGGEKPRWL